MQLRLSKSGTFTDVIIKHIISKLTLVGAIIILYVGYSFIDNMFISKEKDREKSMQKIKKSINEYTEKIKEYHDLLAEIKGTGEDKRVVSGFYLSRIEEIFKNLSNSFDIHHMKISLDVIDSIEAMQSFQISSLPNHVSLVAYSFKITGVAETETDIYDMLHFIERHLPGVVIVTDLSVEAIGFKEGNGFLEMSRIRELETKIVGKWLFLESK